MKPTKLFLLFILFGNNCLWAQLDSTKVQEIEEVTISVTLEKEAVYDNFKYFITDFHIDSSGIYLLLNRFNKYVLYTTNHELDVRDSLELPFQARNIFRDCLGHIHILSKDSIYEITDIIGLTIYDRGSIENYDNFFKNCVASTDNWIYMLELKNFNQTSIYKQIHRTNHRKVHICTIEDPVLVKSALEEYGLITGQVNFSKAQVEYVDLEEFREIRARDQRAQFFSLIVAQPDFHPLFILNDTVIIFDHLNGNRMALSPFGYILSKTPINYHLNKGWKKEMHLDEARQQLYSVYEEDGVQTFARLSSDGTRITRKVKIEGHVFPENVIIHDGFIYYLHKEFVNDNLNKLYRQRL